MMMINLLSSQIGEKKQVKDGDKDVAFIHGAFKNPSKIFIIQWRLKLHLYLPEGSLYFFTYFERYKT